MTVPTDDEVETRLATLERRLKQLEHNQRMLDVHVAALERSVIFRILRRVGRPLLDFRTRAAKWLMRWNFAAHDPSARSPDGHAYAAWTEDQARSLLPPLPLSPRFSLLLRVHNMCCESLAETVASVRAQSYPCWELCICNDASADPRLPEYLSELARSEPRVRTTTTAQDRGMSASLNEAAWLATGDYLMILADEAVLAPDALHWMAAKTPADILYTDEDSIDDEGRHLDPVFKPDWSPDLLLSCAYFGGLMAISRAAWKQCAGLRDTHEGAEEYDLALRITDRLTAVEHIPHVLYHRRKRPRDAALSGEGPRSRAAGRKSLEDAIARRGLSGEIEDGPAPNHYRVRWKPSGGALASIVICSRSPRLLKRCLQALESCTDYGNREIVVVQHLGRYDAQLQAVIEGHGALRVPYSGDFHFSRMNNMAAQHAKGEVLVFLNDDVEPLDPSWLARLVAQAERPDVGAVGARLCYPSGMLQHAGIVVGIGDGAGHIGRGSPGSQYWPWVELTRDVTAVTGACLAIRTELFRSLGGFADDFPINYNDVDLCLRLRQSHLRVIYDAGVVLRHRECQTRDGLVSFQEREHFYERWEDLLDRGDPFYSVHLTREREDLSLRAPVRPNT